MSTLPEKAATGVRRRPIPDELGQGLLQALAAWRPQAVSLHDTTGEALWLSSGSIGPDEHSFVLAALEDIKGGVQMTWNVSVEREGEDKPVLVAEWLTRRYF